MVCRIADNRPLKQLKKELNLPPRCHGKRRECVLGFETEEGNFVMGLPGTAVGYCQGLFNYDGHPHAHTEKVRRLLQEIDAPWSSSHELYWGHRRTETPDDFVIQAMQPLLGTGRVPVLITALDPGRKRSELEAIMNASRAIPKNETILVRTILSDRTSLIEIADVIANLVRGARVSGIMPKWWPLLQGNLSLAQWQCLRCELGDDWDYVNAAVNPFVLPDVFEFLRDQITVAQIPIGRSDGISNDGNIRLAHGMRIPGAIDCAEYSLAQFMSTLTALPLPPTLIILGPVQQGGLILIINGVWQRFCRVCEAHATSYGDRCQVHGVPRSGI